MSDMKVSDNTSVAMPVRNLISIVTAVAVGTMDKGKKKKGQYGKES